MVGGAGGLHPTLRKSAKDGAPRGLGLVEGAEGAIALYAGLGFVVTGQRKEYYRGPVEDALLMRLDLISDQ